MALDVAQPEQRVDRDVVRYGKFSGLRNDIGPERFEMGDLVAATNVDIDKSGQISRRPGFTSVLAGNFHSLWSDNSQCLAVSGGNLKSISTAYVATTLRALSSASTRMSYARVNDKVYFSNGVDTGVVSAGAARTWGITPPTLPGVTVAAGALYAGTYQFALTHSSADGQESGAALAGSAVVTAGGGLVFALPVSSDPRVTTKTLYMSTANGEVLYWANSWANSVTSGSYLGDALDLSLELETQFLQQAPAGQLVAYYRGRLFVAADDVLYPSEPFAYELFDLRKGVQMDGRITLLAPFEDQERIGGEASQSGFFVGTEKSCGTLTGSDEFVYVERTDYGAIEGALAYVDGSVFGDGSTKTGLLPVWRTTEGICVGKPQMTIENMTRARYEFAADGKGAGIFISGDNKLIFSSNY